MSSLTVMKKRVDDRQTKCKKRDVSIIVPVYNKEKHLRTCLRSIMNQTWRQIEVIVIDDGSKDHSYEIIKEYERIDSRFRIVRNHHKGVSAARNTGIDTANGDYLTFVDADDYIEPDYIENLVCSIDSADLCMTGLKSWNMNNDKLNIYQSEPAKIDLSDLRDSITQFTSLFSGIGWKLYRKRIIEDFGLRFEDNIEYGEDTIFCLNYLKYCQSPAVSGGSGYIYRLHDNQSLSSKGSRQIDSQLTYLAELEMISETTEQLRYLLWYCQLIAMWTIVKILCYQVRGYDTRRKKYYEIARKYHLKEKSRHIKAVSIGTSLLKISLLMDLFLPMNIIIKAAGTYKQWDKLFGEKKE